MYCLDTDIAIEYLKGNVKVAQKVDKERDTITITPITLSELFYGAYRSDRTEERLQEVRTFSVLFPELEYSSSVAIKYTKRHLKVF